jgi:hypothetical protein
MDRQAVRCGSTHARGGQAFPLVDPLPQHPLLAASSLSGKLDPLRLGGRVDRDRLLLSRGLPPVHPNQLIPMDEETRPAGGRAAHDLLAVLVLQAAGDVLPEPLELLQLGLGVAFRLTPGVRLQDFRPWQVLAFRGLRWFFGCASMPARSRRAGRERVSALSAMVRRSPAICRVPVPS